jgi:zinc D-Ala-D-Ala dipeptidase
MKNWTILSLFVSGMCMASVKPNFVSIEDFCPGIVVGANYATEDNFTGSIVPGYKAVKALTALKTAQALCRVQSKASKMGFAIKIFDAYRPVKAVSFFQEWAKLPENNAEIKSKYYPSFTREDLFTQGYIAKRSSHSRGSAVDLTLFDLEKDLEVDMGGIFDFFDAVSATETPLISKVQQNNRLILKKLMESEGFKNFPDEWWHYSLKPEPHPNEYFDFDIE